MGWGWALEFSSFLGLVKWHRADRRVPFGEMGLVSIVFIIFQNKNFVLDFFIGVVNRDIMTKELSLICQFFVLFCLSIFSTWDKLSHANLILPF